MKRKVVISYDAVLFEAISTIYGQFMWNILKFIFDIEWNLEVNRLVFLFIVKFTWLSGRFRWLVFILQYHALCDGFKAIPWLHPYSHAYGHSLVIHVIRCNICYMILISVLILRESQDEDKVWNCWMLHLMAHKILQLLSMIMSIILVH